MFNNIIRLTQYLASTIRPKYNLPYFSYTFKKVSCHSQNQHQFHQTPFTFFREVLSCAVNPTLISNQTLNLDARMRAKRILEEIISVGSYSESRGIGFVRDSVCKFIAKMDEVDEPCKQEVILTEGAERGLSLVLRTLIASENDAVMVPAPYYPLHADIIKFYGGNIAEYRLNKEKGWDIDVNELDKVLNQMKNSGKKVKAIMIINPGNPTGQTLSVQTLAKVLQFSVSNRLLVIADEVYRQNIRSQNNFFRSCRNVLETLTPSIRDNCELISIHSMSKGLTMTPGLRAGYLYLHNISPFVMQQLHKFQTFYGCSNIIGQLMIELSVNPFQGMSPTTKELFLRQYQQLRNSIRARGKMVFSALNDMEYINCRYSEGNMYLYPQIDISASAKAAAKRLEWPVDKLYCQQIQQNTGTGLVPGSTFGQPEGSHHFRISPCLFSEQQLPIFLQKLKKANNQFHCKYAH